MSDLQDALDTIWIPTLTVEDEAKLRIIRDAAKAVANPDYEAAAMVSQVAGRPSEWGMRQAKRIVNAALGISEDINSGNEQWTHMFPGKPEATMHLSGNYPTESTK